MTTNETPVWMADAIAEHEKDRCESIARADEEITQYRGACALKLRKELTRLIGGEAANATLRWDPDEHGAEGRDEDGCAVAQLDGVTFILSSRGYDFGPETYRRGTCPECGAIVYSDPLYAAPNLGIALVDWPPHTHKCAEGPTTEELAGDEIGRLALTAVRAEEAGQQARGDAEQQALLPVLARLVKEMFGLSTEFTKNELWLSPYVRVEAHQYSPTWDCDKQEYVERVALKLTSRCRACGESHGYYPGDESYLAQGAPVDLAELGNYIVRAGENQGERCPKNKPESKPSKAEALVAALRDVLDHEHEEF